MLHSSVRRFDGRHMTAEPAEQGRPHEGHESRRRNCICAHIPIFRQLVRRISTNDTLRELYLCRDLNANRALAQFL